ncbi:MAG TPA: DUF3857 domain-containing protein [Terracidiphilus sp.]
MRISNYVCLAAMLVGGTMPLALRAQFQQPTQDELKMTSDPAAPDASAVYLDYEEIDNDPLHYRSVYARIKLLTDKGKDRATVNVIYPPSLARLANFEGRTIHPDGTVISLTAKPVENTIPKNGKPFLDQVVFTLPDATVGSILEFRFQIQYSHTRAEVPSWQVQRKYFVHKAHYVFKPIRDLMQLKDSGNRTIQGILWQSDLPEGVTVKKGPDSLVLDMSDVPPVPNEEYMPPVGVLPYRVRFYYSTQSPKEYWPLAADAWSKEVDKLVKPSNTLQGAVAGIVSPGDSDLVKAEKIYKAVQALDNTDYSPVRNTSGLPAYTMLAAKPAAETWRQKSGTSENLALLYLALAREAGLKAYAMDVVRRDNSIFEPTWMMPNQMSDILVGVMIDGKEVLLDPGEKMCTFGELSWTHSDTEGMLQTAQGGELQKTPPQRYSQNTLERNGDVTVDGNGDMTGNFTFAMQGQKALRWRQAALENDPDELKKAFDTWLQSMMPQGVEAHLDHFLALDKPDANLLAIVKAKGTLGTAKTGQVRLPGVFFQRHGGEPFVKEAQRMEPVDMYYAEETADEVVYHLPAGYAVEGAPEGTNDLWKGHAQLIVKSKTQPGQITVDRVLVRTFDTLPVDDFPELRGFYEKVAAADQSEVTLKQASTGKGN